MLVRTQTKRILTLALALLLLLCWVPSLAVPASAVVTYSYNGYELPDHYSELSDDYKYPYAFLYVFNQSDDRVFLVMYEDINNLWMSPRSTGGTSYYVRTTGKYSSKTVIYEKGVYVNSTYNESETDSQNAVGKVGETLLWSNFNMLDKQGNVILAGCEPIPVNAGISVDLSRTPGSCYAGLSIGISVDVYGEGIFDRKCTCAVSGATSEDTYVFLDTAYETPNLYYLRVGADETASHLTITVRSIADPSISATHDVIIEQLPPPDETTPESEPVPDTPEGEEPIPTEENPTEPGEIPGEDTDGGSEKDEAVGEGGTSVDDLTEIIPDYSEGFIQALQNFAGAMSYTGTEAKLKIPAVMFPQLGDLVPGFQMMEEMELDFEMYVDMMPENLMTLVRSLFTVALIVFCFKEFYGTISYVLTLKGGAA